MLYIPLLVLTLSSFSGAARAQFDTLKIVDLILLKSGDSVLGKILVNEKIIPVKIATLAGDTESIPRPTIRRITSTTIHDTIRSKGHVAETPPVLDTTKKVETPTEETHDTTSSPPRDTAMDKLFLERPIKLPNIVGLGLTLSVPLGFSSVSYPGLGFVLQYARDWNDKLNWLAAMHVGWWPAKSFANGASETIIGFAFAAGGRYLVSPQVGVRAMFEFGLYNFNFGGYVVDGAPVQASGYSYWTGALVPGIEYRLDSPLWGYTPTAIGEIVLSAGGLAHIRLSFVLSRAFE
jgi:hypothetical protein